MTEENKKNSSWVSWASEGEDEIMESIIADSRAKKEEKERKEAEEHEYVTRKFKKQIEDLSEILDGASEYCQIGLVLFMIIQQKTINIFHPGKEDREFNACMLMTNVQNYLYKHIEFPDWTRIVHLLCNNYTGKIKGSLLYKAKMNSINVKKILTPRLLERNLTKNRRLYREAKGCDPP